MSDLSSSLNSDYTCEHQPGWTYILGLFLCLGGMASYLPQYFSLIKSRQATGISELSLLILNVSAAALALNSFILNYWKFECYQDCPFWLCSANLLSVFQILSGWIMVFPLYIIFLRYKIRESTERTINDIMYMIVYVFITIIMIIFGITERELSSNSKNFFIISAQILGAVAALTTSIVWLPQIYKLLKTRNHGNLSLLMFILQAPGSGLVIIMQVMYGQHWSTWLTYVVLVVEQTIIIILIVYFKYKDRTAPLLHTSPSLLDEYYNVMTSNGAEGTDGMDGTKNKLPRNYNSINV